MQRNRYDSRRDTAGAAGRRRIETPPGSAKRLVEILRASGEQLIRRIVPIVGTREIARDVLQASVLKALERLGSVRDPDHLDRWFAQLVKNAAIDQRRRHLASQRALDGIAHDAVGCVGSFDLAPSAACECVGRALEKLSPQHAAMLRHVDVDATAIHTVAQVNGISVNNARVRLHRARRALRARVIECCGGSPRVCVPCECRAVQSPPARDV